MSFGGSFWSFLNFTQNSQIDSLLSNPQTTLEDLLADENILSEFKSLNPKLLDYCNDDKIKQLISYIVEEPPADANKDRGYKFPFVSCEVLTADIETILEAFFGRNPNNLRKHSTESDYSGKADHHEEEESSGERNIELEKDDETLKENKTSQEEKEKEAQEADPSHQDKVEKESAKEEGENVKASEEQKNEEAHTNKETETNKKPSEDLAKYFFSFLDGKELNVTLVGYFARFLNHLILRKPNEIYQYVWQHPEIVDKFIAHVEHKSIAECLAKLFILENSSPKSDEFIDLKIEKLTKLVSLFDEDVNNLNSEAIPNAAVCLVDILSKKSTLHGKEQFAKYFASKDFLDIMFENLFGDKILTVNIVFVLNALLSHLLQNPDEDANEDNEFDSPKKESPEKKIVEINQDNLYSCLYSKAGDIVEYLEKPNEAARDATFGAQKVPLGTARLRLVELVLYAIKLNINKVNSEFALKGLYKVLMRLMVEYEWNNLLHNYIEKIFVSTLESDSHIVRQKLLHAADLLNFLSESTKEVDYVFSNAQHRKVRKGYLGHLTRIAKLLERLSEKDNDIKEYLANEKWTQFKENYLQATLDKDNYDLAKSQKRHTNDFFEDMLEKKEGELDPKHHEGMEEAEDDLNDREYDDSSKDNHQNFINQDIFSKYEGGFEEWNKNDTNGEGQKGEKEIDIWSMGPTDFSMTFKFTGFPEIPKEMEPNLFLELNRKQEIIDIGPQHEPKLEQAYFDNAFWAKPLDQGHKVDDVLKEFESH